MPRSAAVYACTECGHESPKWHGRCPGCGQWNTLAEEARAAPAAGGRGAGAAGGGRAGARALRPVRLGEVETPRVDRLLTGIGELDRVLGGGLVPGSLVLIGGSPGIGKSTLTTGALGNLAAAGRKVLYVSGEESAAQVKLRAERLGSGALGVPIVAETNLEAVLATLEAERPDACVIDSVQVLYDPALSGAPGSVGQVREVAGRVMRVAKERGIATLLVGHVTKEGSLAGPRVLEHLVDCVLSFEGERERTYRTLRALVAPSELVPPRRVANGVDRNRLALVLAVLARHGGVSLGSRDVFVSVAGGVRVDEPGADLAIALALASAAKGVEPAVEGKPLAAFGELGLTGELRHVAHAHRRLAEARKFGLERVVRPDE